MVIYPVLPTTPSNTRVRAGLTSDVYGTETVTEPNLGYEDEVEVVQLQPFC